MTDREKADKEKNVYISVPTTNPLCERFWLSKAEHEKLLGKRIPNHEHLSFLFDMVESQRESITERDAIISKMPEIRQWLFTRVNEIASAEMEKITGQKIELNFEKLLNELENMTDAEKNVAENKNEKLTK